MATILIGSEAEGAAVVPGTAGKGYATRREWLTTGTIHELGIKPEALSKTTKIVLGIRADAAGAVGTFLGETAEFTITELKNEAFRAALLTDVAGTAGTFYWLCVIPILGTLKVKATEVAGTGFKTVGAVTKISEGTWTTAENKYGTPLPIWAEGTPGGASPVWNFRPPTFNTPASIYKPFPEAPQDVLHISTTVKVLEASLSFVGAIQKNVLAKGLAASLTFAGALGKNVTHGLTASLSFVGSLGKNVVHGLSASLSFVGSLGKNVTHGLTASLTFVGTLGKNVTHQLTGALTFVGALGKNILGKSLAASLTFAGTLQKNVVKPLAASLTFIGKLLAKETGKFIQVFEASLSFAGSLNKTTSKTLKAKLESAGALGKTITKPLTASLTFAKTLGKNVTHGLTASLSFVGTLGKNVKKNLAASLTFAGTIKKNVTKGLTASLSFAGSLVEKLKEAAGETTVVRFVAQLSFSGNLQTTVLRRIKVTLIRVVERITTAVTQFTSRQDKKLEQPSDTTTHVTQSAPPSTQTVQGPSGESTGGVIHTEE